MSSLSFRHVVTGTMLTAAVAIAMLTTPMLGSLAQGGIVWGDAQLAQAGVVWGG
jgi:hypothetical protein